MKGTFFLYISLVFVTLTLTKSGFTQPNDANIVHENGHEYYLHVVDKGNTLYAISKLYNVSIESIVATNPGSDKVLKIGQELLIPTGKEVITTAPVTNNSNQNTHTVITGESLYSIAKKYGISMDDIISLNSGVEQGINVGQVLKLPKDLPPVSTVIFPPVNDSNISSTITTDTISMMYDSTSEFKEIYNIAFLLPFMLDANDSAAARRLINEPKTIYGPTSIAMDFYHGALVAIDSLQKAGMSVNAYFYDTRRDVKTVEVILNRKEMAQMDLLIGPVNVSTLTIASEWAKSHNRYIICPASTSNKLLLGNPYLCKSVPSYGSQMEFLATFISANYRNENVICVDSKIKDDALIFKLFKNAYNNNIQEDGGLDSLIITHVGSIKAGEITNSLKADKVNVIVVPSNDLAFVTGFMTKLNALNPHTYNKYKFVVFGMENWQSFDNIDINYKQKYNVQLVSSTSVNYSDANTINYLMKYRNKYHSEPGKFGLMAYDVTLFNLSGLFNYGTNLHNYLINSRYKMLNTGFQYEQTGAESGFENIYNYILRYQDYELLPTDKSVDFSVQENGNK